VAMARTARTGRAITALTWVACALALVGVSDLHAAEAPLPAAGNVAGLPSCVSADWIQFARDDQSALLDEGDRRTVLAEMHRLYPVIEHDGLPVSRIVLWRRGGGQLLFIAAIDNPRKAGEACFIATVSAARFSMTVPLLRKYLPQDAAPP
jgi:hypothetical protein